MSKNVYLSVLIMSKCRCECLFFNKCLTGFMNHPLYGQKQITFFIGLYLYIINFP